MKPRVRGTRGPRTGDLEIPQGLRNRRSKGKTGRKTPIHAWASDILPHAHFVESEPLSRSNSAIERFPLKGK